MTRYQPVRAYWRRIPDRDTKPHLELLEAWERDQCRYAISDELARALEQELAEFMAEEFA